MTGGGRADASDTLDYDPAEERWTPPSAAAAPRNDGSAPFGIEAMRTAVATALDESAATILDDEISCAAGSIRSVS